MINVFSLHEAMVDAMIASRQLPLPKPVGEIVGGIADANRKLAVRALHASMGDRAPAPLAQFAELLAVWEVFPIVDRQEVIGAVIRRGNELHVGMTRVPRASARWLIRETLQKTIQLHGHARTTVMVGNTAGYRFCGRLGFYPVDDNGMDGMTHMRCDNPPHARGGARLKRERS